MAEIQQSKSVCAPPRHALRLADAADAADAAALAGVRDATALAQSPRFCKRDAFLSQRLRFSSKRRLSPTSFSSCLI
eukprot:scaffold5298_cov67-Phaeocystis_antarctica.AAC.3